MPPSNDDPLSAFELPPDVMSSTFEHAISDDAGATHERGHSVASALQRKLKGSVVEYGFPGVVTVHLKSGAVAQCGGPVIGWMIDIVRAPGAATLTIEVDISDGESDPKVVADVLAKVLKKY